MKIEVWADFHCPYCIIGKAKLRRALKELGIKAEIIPRSFLLNPVDDRPKGFPMADHIAMEYGGDREQAMAGFPALDKDAQDYGIKMNMGQTIYAFMLPAHRLFQFAKKKGLGNEFFDKAQHALFEDAARLDEEETLLGLAQSLGLNREETRQVLNSDQYNKEVMADDGVAREMVIDYVPYYIVNGRHHFSGDLPYEDYVTNLKKALNESMEATNEH